MSGAPLSHLYVSGAPTGRHATRRDAQEEGLTVPGMKGGAKHERPKLLEAGVKHERRANDDLPNKRRIFFPFRGWRCDAAMNVSALLSAVNNQTSQV